MPHIGTQIWQELPEIPALFHPPCQCLCRKVVPQDIWRTITPKDIRVPSHFPALVEEGADGLRPMPVPVPIGKEYLCPRVHSPRNPIIIAAHFHHARLHRYTPVLMSFRVCDVYRAMGKIKILPSEKPGFLWAHSGRILEPEDNGGRIFNERVRRIMGIPVSCLKKTAAFSRAHDIWQLPFLIAEIIHREYACFFPQKDLIPAKIPQGYHIHIGITVFTFCL